MLTHNHRQSPLQHVADQRDDPSGVARDPEDVGESDVSAARTIPSRAATPRKQVTANSRPASKMAIHASTTSWSTRRKRAVRTKSLSAIGSSSLPSLVIWPQRRAM